MKILKMKIGKYQFTITPTLLFFAFVLTSTFSFGEMMTISPNQDIDFGGVVDGPHVFYEKENIVVRNFHLTDASCQIDEMKYDLSDRVELQCNLDAQGQVSFSVPLRKRHKAPRSEYEAPSNLFAISDIEGNFQAFVGTLQGNDVIDHNFNWSYGSGHLVLVGDFFDRGDHVTACLWLIYKLEQEALDAGGMVHFINGNHEEMNLRGETRHVRTKYKRVAKSMNMQCKDLYSKNTELGRWLRSKNIVERIGTTLFVHGGISPQIAQSNLSLKRINAIARTNIGETKPLLKMTEKGGDTELVMAKIGPMWYRGYFGNDRLREAVVARGLESFGAERVVVGHTVQPEVTSLLGGRVIAIDVAHAKNMKAGLSNALFIKNGKQLFSVNAKGQRQSLGGAKKAPAKMAKVKKVDKSVVLLKMIEQGKVAFVDRFLTDGNDINGLYSNSNYTLLHYAIQQRQVKIVRYLMNKGANPNILFEDRTALMQAIKTGHRGIIAFLIENVSDLDVQNAKQKTAIFYAAKYGDAAIAKSLVDRGAGLRQKDYKGRTPFQYAAANNNNEVARYLHSLK